MGASLARRGLRETVAGGPGVWLLSNTVACYTLHSFSRNCWRYGCSLCYTLVMQSSLYRTDFQCLTALVLAPILETFKICCSGRISDSDFIPLCVSSALT